MTVERLTTESRSVKVGLAEMLNGGVIMDVVTPEHARIAEDAGARAVRRGGGVVRMSEPETIGGHRGRSVHPSTPAAAALATRFGAEAVFVGSGIFKSDEPSPCAEAIVEASTHFR